MIPLLDTVAQMASIRSEVDQAISRVLDSGQFVLGPEVVNFETQFAAMHGVRRGLGCSSGTAALHLALRGLGVGPGDEVVTVSMTFAATVAAILYTGATPVLVDISESTWTMDPACLEAAIGPRTRAIIPVHLHGRLANMAAIMAIADRHSIPVIEDAAQAHLARGTLGSAGSIGLAGTFSFYPGKNLGAVGEGGAVLTNSDQLAAAVERLRNWGARDRYDQEVLGYNYRMDALQGAVLAVKLSHLERWTESRRLAAGRYMNLLSEVAREGIVNLPAPYEGQEHVFHVFALMVRDPQAVARRMASEGVGSGFHYPIPVHKQGAYDGAVRVVEPIATTEAFAASCLSLPIYPEITEDEQARVVDAVVGAVRREVGA